MTTCDLYHWDWALPLAQSSSFQNNRLTFSQKNRLDALRIPLGVPASRSPPSVAEEVCGDFAEIQVEATTVSLVNGRRRFGLGDVGLAERPPFKFPAALLHLFCWPGSHRGPPVRTRTSYEDLMIPVPQPTRLQPYQEAREGTQFFSTDESPRTQPANLAEEKRRKCNG